MGGCCCKSNKESIITSYTLNGLKKQIVDKASNEYYGFNVKLEETTDKKVIILDINGQKYEFQVKTKMRFCCRIYYCNTILNPSFLSY